MDKAIVTVLLIICGMTAALAIFNGVYPALTQSQSAINSAANLASERIQTRIEIIQAGASGVTATVWVKNIGTAVIANIAQSDLFLGSSGTEQRIPYGASGSPAWIYSIPGGQEEWSQSVTIGITVQLAAPLTTGSYQVTLVLPNGISDDTVFSVN
jgi:hypothetical protein